LLPVEATDPFDPDAADVIEVEVEVADFVDFADDEELDAGEGAVFLEVRDEDVEGRGGDDEGLSLETE
jgi:hypothetical protein